MTTDDYPYEDRHNLGGDDFSGPPHPINAYADGYQQAVDPGWPSDNHVGTAAFELGFDDGRDRYFGTAPTSDQIRWRLIEEALLDEIPIEIVGLPAE
jgi:hypothetical protein